MLLILILMKRKRRMRRIRKTRKVRKKEKSMVNARRRKKRRWMKLREIVESESTKKKRKTTEHQQKVHDAAMTRLPFALAEKGPLHKGVEITPNKRPKPSIQWRAKRGAISKPKNKTPIDHRGSRAFENIRDHQISSLFTLQKHLADCEKGAMERNFLPEASSHHNWGILTL